MWRIRPGWSDSWDLYYMKEKRMEETFEMWRTVLTNMTLETYIGWRNRAYWRETCDVYYVKKKSVLKRHFRLILGEDNECIEVPLEPSIK